MKKHKFLSMAVTIAMLLAGIVMVACEKEEEKEGIYNDYCCYGAIIMVLKGNK